MFRWRQKSGRVRGGVSRVRVFELHYQAIHRQDEGPGYDRELAVVDTNVPVIALLIPFEITAGGRCYIFPPSSAGRAPRRPDLLPVPCEAVLSPHDCKGSKGMFRIGII